MSVALRLENRPGLDLELLLARLALAPAARRPAPAAHLAFMGIPYPSLQATEVSLQATEASLRASEASVSASEDFFQDSEASFQDRPLSRTQRPVSYTHLTLPTKA